MNTIKKVFFVVNCTVMVGSYAPLQLPVVKNASIETFKYAYISPTKEHTSSSGETYLRTKIWTSYYWILLDNLTCKPINDNELVSDHERCLFSIQPLTSIF